MKLLNGYRMRLMLLGCVAAVMLSGGHAMAEPKYVIFLIGDGMGFEQVKAAGMYAHGEPGTLSFESFPYSGELTTYSADSNIPCSAAAATALATGVKVNNGVVSMAIPGDGSELETLLEYSKARGRSTGLVSTRFMTDATPAAFGAHEPSRQNFRQIGEDYRIQTRPNVLFGGGGTGMSIQLFKSAGYTVITDNASMQALDTENIDMVYGRFVGDYGDLPWEPDVGLMPHLSEMTDTALSILDNDPDGFFLMVEGGHIDGAGHNNVRRNMVLETLEFSNAVQVAIDWAAGRTDTLILVAADHETGGLTVLANNGAGAWPTVEWSSSGHTATNVPVYGWGVGAEVICGVMDNTEMFEVVTGYPRTWNADPPDGGTGVWLPPVLGWKPGIYAASHQVYFGESFDDVYNATGAPLQAETTYVPAGVFDVNTTYYWRVDEVNDLHPDSPWVGSVWSFTTEPMAYAIDGANITATACSAGEASLGPENTINGSGLAANDLHSTEATDMWLSDNELLGAWIQYEFDKVHKLHEMWVWNSNQTFEPLFGFGIKDVTVEYSTNGTDWVALADVPEFAQAPGTADYAPNTTVDFAGALAKYVRLTATSNWGGILPQYSLSEVRFFCMPVHARGPYPGSGATDVDPDVTLAWRAGREAATHDVYLSTDEQAVIDGTAFIVNQIETSYSPGALIQGATYYWRIDEVEADGTMKHPGDVWSFTVTAFGQ
ncbi:MAG: alkaline phosphatase [Phycisphaerales bacterium]|nr:MAG: alkaline phosphatase [Phycisphaerales bacterium]